MNQKFTLLITGGGGWLGNTLIKTFCNSEFINDFSSILVSSINIKDLKYLREVQDICLEKNIELKIISGLLNTKTSLEAIRLFISNKKNIYVIYAASIIHAKSRKQFWEYNYETIKGFLKTINKNNLSKFVYISSNSPFGFNNFGKKFDELSNYSPIGNYGKTKMAAEKFLNANLKKDVLKIIRPPWFHGENMPDRQKLFYKKVVNGKFPLILPGKNMRSIVNTIDLSKAALNLLCLPSRHSIYCICEPESISMINFIKIIQKTFDKKIAKNKKIYKNKRTLRAIYLPPFTSSIFSLIDKLIQRLGLYSTIIHVLSELGMNIEMSSERYCKEFPNHKFYSIKESILEELEEAINVK